MRQIGLLLFLSSFLFSVSSVTYADGQKIWFENAGGLSRDHATNGKIKIDQGFFGGYDLEEIVKDNPTALELTKKQSQLNTYAHLSYWFGVIPSAGFLGYGIGSNNSTVGIISAVTLLGTGLLTGYFVSESRHYMYEAVNVYNGTKKAESKALGQLNTIESQFAPLASSSNSISLSFNF